MTPSQIIDTTTGLPRPSRIDDHHRPVLQARGIPVAGAARRFRTADPVQGWSGVKDDDPDPSVAPQHARAFQFADPGPVIGLGGRCVHASVWAPEDADGLPVLVWLHGGGGLAGSSTDRSGAVLALTLHAVVVSLSFRLGALGHLHLPELLGDEYADSGNTALTDIRAGLEWVRVNAAAFGDDPARMTLVGQSAGAAMVAAVLATTWGPELVSSAIMQSGTAERTHDPSRATEVARETAAEVGGVANLLRCPEAELVDAQGRILRPRLRRTAELPTPVRPVLGTPTLGTPPLQALGSGAGSRIPLLIGTNLQECAPMVGVLGAPRTTTDRAQYLAAVQAMRRAGLDVGSDDVAWATDHAYRQPTERVLSARRDLATPTYAYLFMGHCGIAPVHNAELDLLFSPGTRIGATSIADLWRCFVHDGRDGEPLNDFWSVHGVGREVAVLGAHPSIASDPLGKLREAWDRTARG